MTAFSKSRASRVAQSPRDAKILGATLPRKESAVRTHLRVSSVAGTKRHVKSHGADDWPRRRSGGDGGRVRRHASWGRHWSAYGTPGSIGACVRAWILRARRKLGRKNRDDGAKNAFSEEPLGLDARVLIFIRFLH